MWQSLIGSKDMVWFAEKWDWHMTNFGMKCSLCRLLTVGYGAFRGKPISNFHWLFDYLLPKVTLNRQKWHMMSFWKWTLYLLIRSPWHNHNQAESVIWKLLSPKVASSETLGCTHTSPSLINNNSQVKATKHAVDLSNSTD